MTDWTMLANPSGFDWRAAPLSEWYWPFYTAIAYLLIVVAMLPSAVKAAEKTRAEREAAKASTKDKSTGGHARSAKTDGWSSVISSHNMILCLWSAAMFVGCAYELFLRLGEAGEGNLSWLFCEPRIGTNPAAAAPNGTISTARAGTVDTNSRFDPAGGVAATGPLFYWSYIYYISKYYELFDTILALAKGSPPRHLVLHVFHHALVMIMSWLWLEQRQSLQWIGLLFNTFVHVVMYYYFSRVALGQRVSWKHWITRLQILQFTTSLVAFCAFAYAAAGLDILPLMPESVATAWTKAVAAVGITEAGTGWRSACSGWDAVLFNLVFNVTLLLGFVDVLGKNTSSSKLKRS